MSVIEIDYQDTLKKVEQLEALAGELKKVSSDNLRNLQSGVDQGWKGSSAELYKKRMKALSELIDARAGDLQNTANGLRKAAEHYHRLETIAGTIFGS